MAKYDAMLVLLLTITLAFPVIPLSAASSVYGDLDLTSVTIENEMGVNLSQACPARKDSSFKFIQHKVYELPFLYYNNIDLVNTIIHQHTQVIRLVLLSLSAISVIFAIVATRKVMKLKKQLLHQKEACELIMKRKNMAFAQASHDIRSSLAGISGLIHLSTSKVAPGSYLETNLNLMESCSRDLLDRSKIEDGIILDDNLQLSEFNLVTLLEETVDLFHPVAMKKGVDLILDNCSENTLTTQFSSVIGDRGKLKRIISNLLSNAVKFTSHGYISIRAWAKPAHGKDDPECVEYVFEVEDTGKGIPEDKWKTVFENFVQVKGTDEEASGTGLGLGIVQSLVRLMGGDIEIVENKSKTSTAGTCFRFNIFLKTKKDEGSPSAIHFPGGFLGARTKLPRPSLVILFISNEGRRTIIGRYIESLGINQILVDDPNHLPCANREISNQVVIELHDQSMLSAPDGGNPEGGGGSGVILKVDDNDLIPVGFVLAIIDESVEQISSLLHWVTEFKKQLGDFSHDYCKFIWLKNEQKKLCSFHDSGGKYKDELLASDDDVLMFKPLHGSRLIKVIKLLPEYGGLLQSTAATKMLTEDNINQTDQGDGTGDSTEKSEMPLPSLVEENIQVQKDPAGLAEVQNLANPNDYHDHNAEKILDGKRVLLAEDDILLQILTVQKLKMMGATVTLATNGKEALEFIREGFIKQYLAEVQPPFDYIFMDCEMPLMDGYEATKAIRELEKGLGHMTIFSLSAHEGVAERKRMSEAGMDYHLVKPFSDDMVTKIIKGAKDEIN